MPLIQSDTRSDLHRYLGGIVRGFGGTASAINGTADHVHLLVGMPATLAIADAVRVIKANSSKWVNQKRGRKFSWQAGYGAFSVSESNANDVARYICNQEEHHRKMTFQQELLAFLKKHHVAYDERYIWE